MKRANDLLTAHNIRVRRQYRATMMMRPIPGGFEVFIPRWMKPEHPKVRAFIEDGLRKFGGKAPPVPAEVTPLDSIREMVAQWAQRMGVQPERITFRAMQRKWGSCSSAGRITLNSRLVWIAAPLVEYIVLHELAHLRVFNHGKDFKALLTEHMPDWRTREDELNRVWAEFMRRR